MSAALGALLLFGAYALAIGLGAWQYARARYWKSQYEWERDMRRHQADQFARVPQGIIEHRPSVSEMIYDLDSNIVPFRRISPEPPSL